MERDPKNAFHNSKKQTMEDRSLQSHFIVWCRKQSLCSDTASEVYDMFLRKTVHARFSVMFRHWKEANVKRNGEVAFCILLKAQSAAKSESSRNDNSTVHLATTVGKRKEGPLSLPSLRGDSLEQDRKRRCMEWGDLKVPELREELRKRELKKGGRKLELVERLEVYEASQSEARGIISNDNIDKFGDNDDEMAALDVDKTITTQKSMISSLLVG